MTHSLSHRLGVDRRMLSQEGVVAGVLLLHSSPPSPPSSPQLHALLLFLILVLVPVQLHPHVKAGVAVRVLQVGEVSAGDAWQAGGSWGAGQGCEGAGVAAGRLQGRQRPLAGEHVGKHGLERSERVVGRRRAILAQEI